MERDGKSADSRAVTWSTGRFVIKYVAVIVLTRPTLGNAAMTVPPFRSMSLIFRISTSATTTAPRLERPSSLSRLLYSLPLRDSAAPKGLGCRGRFADIYLPHHNFIRPGPSRDRGTPMGSQPPPPYGGTPYYPPIEGMLTRRNVFALNVLRLVSGDVTLRGLAHFLTISGAMLAALASLAGGLGSKRTTDMQNLGLLIWAGVLLNVAWLIFVWIGPA